MQFTNDELLFILDALKRRELELVDFRNAGQSDSCMMAIELQEKIIEHLGKVKVNV